MTFLESLKTYYNNNTIQTILGVSRLVSSVALVFSLAFFALYSIGYSFLYGWYFSGQYGETTSLLDMIIHPVPFNFYSVMVISLIFLILLLSLYITYKISNTDNGENRTGKLRVFFLLVLSLILYPWLDLLFMHSPPQSYSYWLVPILFVPFVFLLAVTKKTPFQSIAAIGYSLLLVHFSKRLLEIEFGNFTFFLTVIIISVICTLLLQKINNGRLKLFLGYFPILYFIGTRFVDAWYEYIIYLLASIIIAIILTWIRLTWNYSMSKKKPKDAGYNFTLKSLYSEDKMLFVMLILILIMFLTSLPIGTLMTGKYLRDSVPTRSLDEIMYQNNQQLIGKIVAEKNGTFYISNQDWQLVMIKSDEVSTTPQK